LAGRATPDAKIQSGTVIGKYKIETRLGLGPHAEVYKVDTAHGVAAMKIENPIATLKHEATVLKAFSQRKTLYSCDFFEFVEESKYGAYLVMELLGEDISSYRKRQKSKRLDPDSLAQISIQMVRALQAFHSAGFVHRDIKPSNFVRRLSDRRKHRFDMVLVDFGLARKYLDNEGNVKSGRNVNANFRGTTKYASISAHEQNELGRKDDLYSLFYLLVDFVTGSLPWTVDIGLSKEVVYGMKSKLQDEWYVLLPKPLQDFLGILKNMDFHSTPRYTDIEMALLKLNENDVLNYHGICWGNADELVVQAAIEAQRRLVQPEVDQKAMEVSIKQTTKELESDDNSSDSEMESETASASENVQIDESVSLKDLIAQKRMQNEATLSQRMSPKELRSPNPDESILSSPSESKSPGLAGFSRIPLKGGAKKRIPVRSSKPPAISKKTKSSEQAPMSMSVKKKRGRPPKSASNGEGSRPRGSVEKEGKKRKKALAKEENSSSSTDSENHHNLEDLLDLEDVGETKNDSGDASVGEHSDLVVGLRIEVWWPLDKKYYRGLIKKRLANGSVKVVYDDGDDEILDLSVEKYRLLAPRPGRRK